jgi:hypothetical protein
MPSGTAFARDIVRKPCTSIGVKIISILRDESGGSLKKHWNIDLEKWFNETLLLVSNWTPALRGISEIFLSVRWNLEVTSPNTFVGAAPQGSSKRQHC